MLMPEKIKHKTAVIRNNLNPVWEEVFVFHKVSTKFIYDNPVKQSVLTLELSSYVLEITNVAYTIDWLFNTQSRAL